MSPIVADIYDGLFGLCVLSGRCTDYKLLRYSHSTAKEVERRSLTGDPYFVDSTEHLGLNSRINAEQQPFKIMKRILFGNQEGWVFRIAMTYMGIMMLAADTFEEMQQWALFLAR